jgi:outer membrane protein assembly factor BamB
MQDHEFSPDTIDAQTDRDTANLSAQDARLVDALHRLHQLKAARNAASLVRVKARLQRQEQRVLASQNAFKLPLTLPPSQLTYTKDQHMLSDAPSPRSGQVWRRFSVIAASLLLVVLVGSLAALLTLAHQDQHLSIETNRTTPSAIPLTTIPDPAPAAGMYVVSAKDFGDYQISKLDSQTHEPLWTQEVGALESSVVVYGTTIYVSSGDVDYSKHDNYVYALDAQTGTVRWRMLVDHDVFRLPDGSGPYDLGVLNTPTVTGGVLYVQARDGKLFALDAATGKEHWVYQAPARAMVDGTIYNVNPLALKQGVIYGALQNVLFAIDARTGKQLWLEKTDDTQLFNAPQFDGEMIFLSSYEVSNHSNPDAETGYVYAYTGAGKQQWKRSIGHWVLTDPIAANGLLYFTSYDGQFHALRERDGSEAWHFTLPGPTWDDAILSAGALYIDAAWQSGSDAQGHPLLKTTLYALHPTSGGVLWKQIFGGEDTLDTVQQGVVYMGFFPGVLAALSTKDGTVLWQHRYGAKLIDKTGTESEPAPIVTVID